MVKIVRVRAGVTWTGASYPAGLPSRKRSIHRYTPQPRSFGKKQVAFDRKPDMIAMLPVPENQGVLARNVKGYPLFMDIARSPGILTVRPTVPLLREQPAV
jgi:hypothetical protein